MYREFQSFFSNSDTLLNYDTYNHKQKTLNNKVNKITNATDFISSVGIVFITCMLTHFLFFLPLGITSLIPGLIIGMCTCSFFNFLKFKKRNTENTHYKVVPKLFKYLSSRLNKEDNEVSALRYKVIHALKNKNTQFVLSKTIEDVITTIRLKPTDSNEVTSLSLKKSLGSILRDFKTSLIKEDYDAALTSYQEMYNLLEDVKEPILERMKLEEFEKEKRNFYNVDAYYEEEINGEIEKEENFKNHL